MGKEVRVPRASRREGFAPVSPGGFIEPHIAWYGVPATVLYAMYQNAADPGRRSFANCNAIMEVFFILNLPGRALTLTRKTSFYAIFISSEFNSCCCRNGK